MEELNDYKEPQESNFDLKAEIYKYLAYWKWLVFGLILGGLAAYLYNRYTIPEYRTEASMMILNEQEKSLLSTLPSGGGSILSVDDASLGNQIETLKSKSLTEKVVDELDHNVQYYEEGNLITVEAYKKSPVYINFVTPDSIVHQKSAKFVIVPKSSSEFELRIGEKESGTDYSLGEEINIDELTFSILPRSGSAASGFVRNNPIIIKISPLRETAKKYTNKLEIMPKGQSKDILTLSLVDESSERSEDFLNNLMVAFNEDGVLDKKQVSESTALFVQDRLEIITSELDSVEGGMADFKRENRIMDVVGSASEFKSISTSAEEEMFKLETQQILLNSVQEMLRNQEDYELLPSDIGIEEGSVSGLVQTYNELVLERNAMLRTSTEENPVIQAISSQIDSLRENLGENIQSTLNSVRIRLNEFDVRERQAQGVFSTFPGLERGIRGIERQQQIKEQLYLFLLEKREEAAISSAATSNVAKVIDPAFTAEMPVGPKSWIILLSGLLIGLIVPLLVIFVKNMLDTKVHHKADLQQLGPNIPFIGEIPSIEKTDKDVVQKNDRSVLAESFRVLRTNLSYLAKGRGGEQKVIFVTSTIKGEGKTFIAYNLARTLSASGKKVLLVGADIRNPQLHRYAEGLRAGFKGLSEYLYDENLQFMDIVNTKDEGEIPIDIILSGRIPPNPAELLLSSRMVTLLDEAKQHYDYIIVDTAPTMVVTDTLLISPYADTTIYVARAGYTEKGLLNYAKELYDEEKIKGMAIVVNNVDYSKFGYAAKYGYSYTYGYGVDKESWFKSFYNRTFKKK